jgi:DNA-binding GntR family transcriptional regulator
MTSKDLDAIDVTTDGSSDIDAPISAESITSRIYARLKHDIIAGKLTPGLKLKIESLRRDYDVGTSPIREALSLLTSDHLVERIDQRGFRVADVSEAEFSELLRTRCWLEERALRESMGNATPDWEERVVLASYRLSRIPRSDSTTRFVANDAWETAHRHFHMTLLSECGSSILLRFCGQLYDQNIRYRQISGASAYPKRDIVAEHDAIRDAVLGGDADLACKLLIDHYTQTGKFVTFAL